MSELAVNNDVFVFPSMRMNMLALVSSFIKGRSVSPLHYWGNLIFSADFKDKQLKWLVEIPFTHVYLFYIYFACLFIPLFFKLRYYVVILV